jgi:regulator of ribonuclease activity A
MATWTTPDLTDGADGSKYQVLLPTLLRSFGGAEKFCGRVATVQCIDDNSMVKELAGTPGDGRVMVVDGAGSLRRALLGDMIAANALKNGWAGVVIHGCARDVEIMRGMPLGVLAIAACPVKTVKLNAGTTGVPVAFGGVVFTEGAWLYADANGVIVAGEQLH